MSRLNLCLILISIGLWSSIYVLKFKEDIVKWYHIRFDKSSPPLPPDGKMPEVPLPFRYDQPMTEDENEAVASRTDHTEGTQNNDSAEAEHQGDRAQDTKT